jgi:hypothetical protein
MVTFAPEPCDIAIFCEPLVAFSMNQSLLTVLGPIVIVHSESSVPVYFKNIDLPGSVEPSAIVVVCVSALVVMASVPKLNASAINSKLVLVVAPHVVDCSPSPISSSHLQTYLPLYYPMLLYLSNLLIVSHLLQNMLLTVSHLLQNMLLIVNRLW